MMVKGFSIMSIFVGVTSFVEQSSWGEAISHQEYFMASKCGQMEKYLKRIKVPPVYIES